MLTARGRRIPRGMAQDEPMVIALALTVLAGALAGMAEHELEKIMQKLRGGIDEVDANQRMVVERAIRKVEGEKRERGG